MKRVLLLFSVWLGNNIVLADQFPVKGVCKQGSNNNACQHVQAIAKDLHDFRSIHNDFPNARIIDFHGSLMESFSGQGLSLFRSLETLNLSYNHLTDNVMQSVQSSNLKKVDLTYNRIKYVEVPHSVEVFRARRNQLESIRFSQGNKLITLELSQNEFKSFANFTNLNRLQELDLSCNEIQNVDFRILSAMKSLKTLLLARNHISVFGGPEAQVLYNLEVLDLSNNIMTSFDLNGKLPKLRELSISNNKIVIMFGTYNQLKVIDLTQNDLDCSHLRTFINAHQLQTVFPDRSCNTEAKKQNNLCCTESTAPYADRLISYQKEKYKTLLKSSAQIEYGANCSSYVPNPCDGDDTLTRKVATNVIQTLQSSFAENHDTLANLVRNARTQLENTQRQYQELENEHAQSSQTIEDLLQYISTEYRLVGSQTITDPIEMIKATFAMYDEENRKTRELIRQEERDIGDKLDEENRIQAQIDDVKLDIESKLEELNERNQTVIELKNKLAEYKARLDATRKNG